jgi:hypothetical protein
MVLLIGQDQWKCLKCISAKCVHILNWRKCKGTTHEDVPDHDPLFWTAATEPMEDERKYEGWIIPDTPIPSSMETIISSRGFADVSNIQITDLTWSKVTPLYFPMCRCGSDFDVNAPSFHCRVIVYGSCSARNFNAPYYPCKSVVCDKKLEFDNVDLGLIRLTREVMMDIVAVSRIYKDIAVGGFAMSRIHCIMAEQLASLGFDFMGRETFRKCCLVILKRYDRHHPLLHK